MSFDVPYNHQLSFCTRKILRPETGGIHNYLNFRSFKNYIFDYYNEALKQLDFPNYEIFDDVNEVYSNFFQKIMAFIEKIAPYRSKQVKKEHSKVIS